MVNIAMSVGCVFFIGFLIQYCSSACTHFPTTWDGSWYDSQFHEESTKGIITFSQSEKRISSGWHIELFGTTQTDFTCVLSSDGLLVFKSAGTGNGFGVNQHAIVCIAITKKTDYSYMYYRRGGTNTPNGDRLTLLAETDNLTESTSTYCDGTANTEDFGIIVQQGHYGDVGITLPNPFLGIYNYTFTNDGTTYKCSGTSSMDGCTDKTLVKLNTSLCNEELLDSDDRQFYCVAYASSGSTYYIALIHADASTTHRSTCVTATISGQSVTASTDPGSCKVDQSSSTRTSHSASVLITMEPYEICYSDSKSITVSVTVELLVLCSFVIPQFLSLLVN